MTPLDSIARQTGTDKAWHDYPRVYDPLFEPFRHNSIRMVEIGVDGGASIEMWSQYFSHPNTEILGIEIHDKGYRCHDPRVKLLYGFDASDPNRLDSLEGKFDLIIEDGSHLWTHQLLAFQHLWHKVQQGGYFVTEDLHVVHSSAHQAGMTMSIIEHYGWVAKMMQDPDGARGCAAYNQTHPYSEIESITLRKGLAIIRKR